MEPNAQNGTVSPAKVDEKVNLGQLYKRYNDEYFEYLARALDVFLATDEVEATAKRAGFQNKAKAEIRFARCTEFQTNDPSKPIKWKEVNVWVKALDKKSAITHLLKTFALCYDIEVSSVSCMDDKHAINNVCDHIAREHGLVALNIISRQTAKCEMDGDGVLFTMDFVIALTFK